MTGPRRRVSHVVVDTDALSWALDPRPHPRGTSARRLIGGRTRVVSFVTVTDLRYGALLAGCGELRLRSLARRWQIWTWCKPASS